MDVNKIRKELEGYDRINVERFISYAWGLLNTKKNGQTANPWMAHKSDDFLISAYKNVEATGLVFDGVHVTIQSTGTSYDHQAYKNKMLIAYPESHIDTELVYEGDTFAFDKDSGQVRYTHNINDPFGRDESGIIGGYCVIKNKRGEFLTILTRADIDKHRKVARTDFIWKAWFAEMARKTVIKKACKQHFEDIFQDINEADNENCDIGNPLDVELGVKGEIEEIETVKALQKYWEDNKEKHQANMKGFNYLISNRKEHLTKVEESEADNADN